MFDQREKIKKSDEEEFTEAREASEKNSPMFMT